MEYRIDIVARKRCVKKETINLLELPIVMSINDMMWDSVLDFHPC